MRKKRSPTRYNLVVTEPLLINMKIQAAKESRSVSEIIRELTVNYLISKGIAKESLGLI